MTSNPEGGAQRHALITGGSSGIGRAVALSLDPTVGEVTLLGRHRSSLEAVGSMVESTYSVTVNVVECDLADEESLDSALAHIGGLPPVDIFIHAAGGSSPIAPGSLDGLSLNRAIATELVAPIRISSALLESMTHRASGRVIFLTGSSEPSTANASNIAKAGLQVWAKALSREVGRTGITVNCVSPGYVLTPQFEQRIAPNPEVRDQLIADNVPVERWGRPHEVADVIWFLAQEKCGFLTGEVIHIDGGARRYAH